MSIAATNSRNKHPIIKRTLHIVKDIYKLFHNSSKRENVLHEIQCALEQPVLKIPEAVDIRWLSTYRIVHAIFLSYKSIIMACEHIHKDGADLISLAGGILLAMMNSNFIVGLVILDDTLNAVSNLCKVLQRQSLKISQIPLLVSETLEHLRHIDCLCD